MHVQRITESRGCKNNIELQVSIQKYEFHELYWVSQKKLRVCSKIAGKLIPLQVWFAVFELLMPLLKFWYIAI